MASNLMAGVAEWFHRLNPYDPARLERNGLKPIELEESSIRKNAASWIFFAFVCFLAWAIFAPLDAGVNVPGTVAVMGNRKAVQHPAGGVVHEILVREGSPVKQGEVLLRINPLGTLAELTSIELDYVLALATESRLQSERENRASIAWLRELDTARDHHRTREAKLLQEKLFRSRRAEYASQDAILEEQINGMQAYYAGLKQVLQAHQDQLSILTGDWRSNEELASQGFIPRARVNDIQRARIDIMASIASTTADMSKTLNGISGTRLQLLQHLSSFQKEVDNQLAEVQKNRKALQSKAESLRFNLSLADLKAPVAGTVVGLKTFTVGGVIQPGQVLMEIVPREGTLIAEAQIPTNLIDKVWLGLEADMRFTAFNINSTPVIPGRVVLVGVDKITGPAANSNGQQAEYYLAQIQTTEKGFSLLGDKVIQPGMPVEVIIKTGERSFMSYLVKPITDRFAKSFID